MAVEVEVDRTRRLFTIEEYERMFDAGILTEQDRVELIDGEIIEMSPAGNRHVAFVMNLTHLLVHAVGDHESRGVSREAQPLSAVS